MNSECLQVSIELEPLKYICTISNIYYNQDKVLYFDIDTKKLINALRIK